MTQTRYKEKIILFDLDGTLIDSTEAILESFARAYAKFEVAVPDDEAITSLVGLPLDMMFVQLGVDEAEAMNYVNAYKEHYRTIHTQKTVLLDKAEEAVKLAHEGATLGVVTTKTAQYSRELLEHFNLMQYFDVLIGREDVQNPKPHPEPIFKALDTLGSSDETLSYMIGDTINDILAAHNAGIASIGVLCGYGSQNELEAYADFITKNALDAVQIIKNL